MTIIPRTRAVTQRGLVPGMAAQITDIVRTLAMPLPVKEMILDQVLGYHDGLHRPARKRQEKTPMAVRVAQARDTGGFLYQRTRTDGADVYAYCKVNGQGGDEAYEVAVRDGQPLSCTCKAFEFGSLHDPDYLCKHMGLMMEPIVTSADETEPSDPAERILACCDAEWDGESETVIFYDRENVAVRSVEVVFSGDTFLWVHAYPGSPFSNTQYEAAAVLWRKRRGLCPLALRKENG